MTSTSSFECRLIRRLQNFKNRATAFCNIVHTALTLRAVFHLALRQTEGLIGSVLQLLGLDLPVPDYSPLSRRAQSLELPAQPRTTGGPIHLMVDSSGLKLGGPGEWLVEKHGTSRRRS
jgi:hypothetical protein